MIVPTKLAKPLRRWDVRSSSMPNSLMSALVIAFASLRGTPQTISYDALDLWLTMHRCHNIHSPSRLAHRHRPISGSYILSQACLGFSFLQEGCGFFAISIRYTSLSSASKNSNSSFQNSIFCSFLSASIYFQQLLSTL